MSYEEALWTDVNFILVAQAGHLDMMKAIFGSAEPPPNKPAKGADGKILKLTPTAFDTTFDKPRETRGRGLRKKSMN